LKTVLDDIDRKLVNLIQGDFPLVREPFSALGIRLGVSGDEVIHRIERLKRDGIVRLIGPVFDARRLGYHTTLVAMRVQDNQLENAANVISEHPGVSHSYQRDNSFNLWFTLALPSTMDISTELRQLNDLTCADDVLDLPALMVFKIGAYFDVLGNGEPAPVSSIDYSKPLQEDTRLSPADRALIKELQQDMLLVERPFDQLLAKLHVDIDELQDRLRSLQRRGIMRRFSASIKHNEIGFTANAMACWTVSPDMVEIVGRRLASLREVSHCYERRANSIWPYNLFAMIHGYTREACEDIASQVSSETGCRDYVLLFSVREFKKVRVKYLV
jgi:DNA-binding Lrp family transcriptional regulator